MVMELCTNGSLWDVLQNDSGVKVAWPQFLEWGIQLASGVAALHDNEPQIVHRDLKSLNLLVNSQWVIKVCDFGLSRFSTTSNLETLAKMRGTMAYCVRIMLFFVFRFLLFFKKKTTGLNHFLIEILLFIIRGLTLINLVDV